MFYIANSHLVHIIWFYTSTADLDDLMNFCIGFTHANLAEPDSCTNHQLHGGREGGGGGGGGMSLNVTSSEQVKLYRWENFLCYNCSCFVVVAYLSSIYH